MRRLIPVLLLGSALAACSSGGGGSGSDGGGTVVTPTPTPAPGSTPTPTPTVSPTPTPVSSEPASGADFFSSIALLYSAQPNIAACQAGTLKPEVAQRVLATLNDIRAHHNLPAVTYAPADEPAVQQSALMMAANGALSHNPPTSWLCYTSAGATAAGQSNIYLGTGGLRYSQDADIMIGWLTDTNNVTANNIGHRRWLLYPFLSTIAYGRVAGTWQTSNRADGASIKVINSTQNTAGPLPDYVAYPFQDYPAKYFDTSALLSFSVIANKTSNFGANSSVSFANAVITVKARGGAMLTVSNQSWDNEGYGLPNSVQWNVAGLTANTIYDVTINNVTVSGAARNYSYYFKLVP
ncbi:CAP domain-containing protein [Sphingomonas sp. KR3-1]|uniref:CAP domain-containing protein n=1 Tax=Sphingomonas sp. KR3-1 TaxID=3156611 RepID=UPI0032B48466